MEEGTQSGMGVPSAVPVEVKVIIIRFYCAIVDLGHKIALLEDAMVEPLLEKALVSTGCASLQS